MSAHTPGPWDLDEGDLRTVYDLETSDIIAEVDVDAGEKAARLIAAAPETIAALKALLDATERHVFGDECKAERDAARAAIAKAEGRG